MSICAAGFAPGSMPAEYLGGLGEKGKSALQEFAAAGGTLIFLNHATEYAIDALGLKVKNVVARTSENDFYSPGALLNVQLDKTHPLCYGLPGDIPIWSEGSPAFDTQEKTVARYPASGILASGLLLGESGPGEVRRGEIGLMNPTTTEPVPVEAIAGKVLTETGELTAVVTILHDRREALERVHLYEQLKIASDELQARVQAATAELATQNELLRRQAIELEQASRLKSQFLANMSHEFRTPLNAILGYTHMLLQGVAGELLPPVKRQLQRIDSNGRHLLTIINEILDITRIEAGKMPIQITEFDVNELVPEVMVELDPMIVRSKLAVTPKLSPELPLVNSDRQKVKQIVVNLLSNALKFTHQGSIEIAVGFDAGVRTASIAVTDTGIGIAPEHHEKIFEDFRQVDDSPSRQYGGTGLGLAICRRLATALGGRITLHSTVGQGSTFTLSIPVDIEQ